jgi:nitroreductase
MSATTPAAATDLIAIDLLLGRSSAAQLVEPAPTAAEVETMLQASVTAPDHGRIRPWRFVVMRGQGRARLGTLMADALRASNAGVSESEMERERAKPLRAPLVISLAAQPNLAHKVPGIEQVFAATAAGAQLMLAANALGYGAAWRTGGAAHNVLVRRGLGLTDDASIIGFFYIGTEAPGGLRLPRAAITSVVKYWEE